MNKIIALLPLVALAACGPIVKTGDLVSHLESQGYTKVMIQPKELNCGRFGEGHHFLGTQKDGTKILGQICYKKSGSTIKYQVDTNKVISGGNKSSTNGISDPWKK